MTDAERIAVLERRVDLLLEANVRLHRCFTAIAAVVFSDLVPGECPLPDEPAEDVQPAPVPVFMVRVH